MAGSTPKRPHSPEETQVTPKTPPTDACDVVAHRVPNESAAGAEGGAAVAFANKHKKRFKATHQNLSAASSWGHAGVKNQPIDLTGDEDTSTIWNHILLQEQLEAQAHGVSSSSSSSMAFGSSSSTAGRYSLVTMPGDKAINNSSSRTAAAKSLHGASEQNERVLDEAFARKARDGEFASQRGEPSTRSHSRTSSGSNSQNPQPYSPLTPPDEDQSFPDDVNQLRSWWSGVSGRGCRVCGSMSVFDTLGTQGVRVHVEEHFRIESTIQAAEKAEKERKSFSDNWKMNFINQTVLGRRPGHSDMDLISKYGLAVGSKGKQKEGAFVEKPAKYKQTSGPLGTATCPQCSTLVCLGCLDPVRHRGNSVDSKWIETIDLTASPTKVIDLTSSPRDSEYDCLSYKMWCCNDARLIATVLILGYLDEESLGISSRVEDEEAEVTCAAHGSGGEKGIGATVRRSLRGLKGKFKEGPAPAAPASKKARTASSNPKKSGTGYGGGYQDHSFSYDPFEYYNPFHSGAGALDMEDQLLMDELKYLNYSEYCSELLAADAAKTGNPHTTNATEGGEGGSSVSLAASQGPSSSKATQSTASSSKLPNTAIYPTHITGVGRGSGYGDWPNAPLISAARGMPYLSQEPSHHSGGAFDFYGGPSPAGTGQTVATPMNAFPLPTIPAISDLPSQKPAVTDVDTHTQEALSYPTPSSPPPLSSAAMHEALKRMIAPPSHSSLEAAMSGLSARSQKLSAPPALSAQQVRHDETFGAIFRVLTTLLPGSNSRQSDILLDILMAFLRTSMLSEKLAELLRNDSVQDISRRSKLYFAVIDLVTKIYSSDSMLPFLSERRRGKKMSIGVLGIMKSSALPPNNGLQKTRAKTAKAEQKVLKTQVLVYNDIATDGWSKSLWEIFGKVYAQSKVFLKGVEKAKRGEFGDAEGEKTIKLCQNFVGLRDAMDGAIAKRTFSSITPAQSNNAKAKGKGKAKDASNPHLSSKSVAAIKRAMATSLNLDYHGSLAFDYVEGVIATHHHKASITSLQESPRGRVLNLTRELATMSTSLPAGIFVRVEDDRPDVIKALIVGPEGTPYEGGLYEFDLWAPMDYPISPPLCMFKTTGLGTVHFNPNLYPCGKVCLSILNTWSGATTEKWQPGISSLLQVLVSIQSMILCESPWYNEPGRREGTQLKQSEEFNQKARFNNIRWAMLDWMQDLSKKDGIWKAVIKEHFFNNQNYLASLTRRWSKTYPIIANWPQAAAVNKSTFTHRFRNTEEPRGMDMSAELEKLATAL